MKNVEDIRLIEECLQGNQRAFKDIYELYHGYVYTICIRYGVKQIEVKDCMQIIFMELFKSLPKFDPSLSQFKTWMSRVCINQILTYNNKTKVDYVNLEDLYTSVIENNIATPTDLVLDREYIFEILNQMPPKFSVVFNLHIIDGYSHAEIAEKLNITKGASRILLLRGRNWAMKKLKIYIEEYGKPVKLKKTS